MKELSPQRTQASSATIYLQLSLLCDEGWGGGGGGGRSLLAPPVPIPETALLLYQEIA